MADAVVFLSGELEAYFQDLKNAREKASERNVKKFMRTEGSKLRKETKSAVQTSGMDLQSHVKRAYYMEKYKGYHPYINSIKRGRYYTYRGVPAIRVYSSAPHAHLLEYGHRIVGPEPEKKSTGKSTRAFEAFVHAEKQFEEQYFTDVERFHRGVFSDLW